MSSQQSKLRLGLTIGIYVIMLKDRALLSLLFRTDAVVSILQETGGYVHVQAC